MILGLVTSNQLPLIWPSGHAGYQVTVTVNSPSPLMPLPNLTFIPIQALKISVHLGHSPPRKQLKTNKHWSHFILKSICVQSPSS